MLICVVICNEIRQKWETHVRVTLETVPQLIILVFNGSYIRFTVAQELKLITIILRNYYTVGSCFDT